MTSMEIETNSEAETFSFARGMGERARPSEIYCLCGELGAGKTVFAKGFAEGLGVKGVVSSPTFAIVNEYSGRIPLYHFDVYRVAESGEPGGMEDTGYEEYFYGGGCCLLEWAELVRGLIPENAVWISIEKDPEKSELYRKITVEKSG